MFFWTWKDFFPHRRQMLWDLLWRLPKLEVPFVILCRVQRGREGEKQDETAWFGLRRSRIGRCVGCGEIVPITGRKERKVKKHETIGCPITPPSKPIPRKNAISEFHRSEVYCLQNTTKKTRTRHSGYTRYITHRQEMQLRDKRNPNGIPITNLRTHYFLVFDQFAQDERKECVEAFKFNLEHIFLFCLHKLWTLSKEWGRKLIPSPSNTTHTHTSLAQNYHITRILILLCIKDDGKWQKENNRYKATTCNPLSPQRTFLHYPMHVRV